MIQHNKPIINPVSEQLLHHVSKKLPQSLLLTGDSRVGLSTIAVYISELRGVTPTTILPEKDERIDIEKGAISIGIIRRLYDDTRTKTTKDRIVIIDYAERMTHQAQNAFLKLLEEPNDKLYFILVSHSVSKLLPTIISRVENLNIQPITLKQSNQLLDDLGVTNEKIRIQILFIADGLPAEITKLSTDKEYFDHRTVMMHDAKQLLQSGLYDKLLIAQRYKDSRVLTLTLLADAANILKKDIIKNPQFDTVNYIDKLLKTYQRIEANGNIRLCLAQMVI